MTKSFIVILLLTAMGVAADIPQKPIADLFAKGAPPTAAQAKMKWKCFVDNDSDPGGQNCATDYGFTFGNGKFAATKFGLSGQSASMSTTKNALLFEDKTKESRNFLAIRSVVENGGPRLIIEESTTNQSWQKPKKSSVTGYTPNLYIACMPEDEFLKSLLGKSAGTGKASVAPAGSTR